MLERYFVKPSTVDRIRTSWLAPEIERYVEWMDLQGYAIRNIYRRVPMLCRFAEFAKQHGSTDVKSAAAQIEEFASHWLAAHETNCKTTEARRKVIEEARNPVRQMRRLALEGRVTADRQRKSFPFEAQAPGFLRYLQEERGLREATIYHYVHRPPWIWGVPQAIGSCPADGTFPSAAGFLYRRHRTEAGPHR